MAVPKTATYEARQLALLEEVGALDRIEGRLLARAAELGGNSKVVTADSIEVLQKPEAVAVLFPREQRAVAKLWKHLEWEEVAEPPEETELPSIAVIDISKMERPVNATTALAVSELPEEHQALALRIQLLNDSDSDPDTVSLSDVEAALPYQGFTTTERAQMAKLKVHLLNQLQKTPAQMTAIAEVPPPGRQTVPIPYAGQAPFFLSSEIKIEERVSLEDKRMDERSLLLTQTLGIEVEVADGEKLVVMPHERLNAKSDVAVGAGRHALPLARGRHRVERWKGGQRIESADINIPSTELREENLSIFLDHQLRTNGDPLPRTLVKFNDNFRITDRGPARPTAVFEFSFDAVANTETDPEPFSRRQHKIPAGRYQLNEHIVLDVFESGAARTTNGGGHSLYLPWSGPAPSTGNRIGTEWLQLYPDGTFTYGPIAPSKNAKRYEITEDMRLL